MRNRLRKMRNVGMSDVFIDGNLKTAITFEWMKLFGCSFHCYKAIENTHNVFVCICFRGKGKIAKYAKINTPQIKVCIQYSQILFIT